MKRDWYENNIYLKIFQHIYSFLMLNICLVITIFPLFLVSLFTILRFENLIFFSLFGLTLGPSIKAAMGCINLMLETKELAIFKDYFESFKKGFLESAILWFLYSVIVFFVINDIYLIMKKNKFVIGIPMYIILLVILTGFILNCYYFRLMNPKHRVLSVMRLSFYCCLKKCHYTLLNSILVLLLLLLMFLRPPIGFFIMPSLFIYLVLINCKNLYPTKGE